MAYPSILRFTRPRTFLYVMSLRTGTELIVLSLLINKLTGVYGILALFTGFHLSSMQLSMYLYSIFALLVTAWLAPHVRKQSPLQCLALAWFYVIDSVLNALYTVAFGVGWFLVLVQHHGGGGKDGPGGKTMGDTAGFTNPQFTVSHVDVVQTPAPSTGATVNIGPDVALVGHQHSAHGAGASSTPSVSGVLGTTILHSGSIASITVISALWAIRVYFILVIMAYARGILRQHIMLSQASHIAPPPDDPSTLNASIAAGGTAAISAGDGIVQIPTNTSSDAADFKPMLDGGVTQQTLPSPFTPPAGLSVGWHGKLGRILVSIFPSYWLGAPVDSEEAAAFGAATAAAVAASGSAAGGKRDPGTPGVFERERRRRAGTGPPMLKPIELGNIRT